MTTTNRAFIKVYRHDTAEPTPGASATAAVRSAAMAAASIEYVTSAAAYAPPVGTGGSNTALLAGSIDVLAPPAQLAVDTAGTAPSLRRPREQALPTRRIEPPQTSKRPLSAFMAHERREVFAKTTEREPNGLQPGTIVASFHWPAVCRALTSQGASELDRVADVVSQYARAGKSMIGILSLFPGSGCTTVALALAERLAGNTLGTILVDGNFCRPRLADWLDAVPTAGWQEVLQQQAPLADAIIRATDDRLDLLAVTGRTLGAATELVARPQTSHAAHLLREAYGLALVDLGAFFDARSQAVAIELVRRMGIEAVFAVAGPTPADVRDLAAIDEQLGRSGCELVGVVENRIPDP